MRRPLPFVELVRVGYGLHFSWYLASFLQLAPLHANPPEVTKYAAAGTFVSLALAAGLFTPVALLALALGFHGFFADRIGWNLCHCFGALLAWSLWLRGAGRRWSLDALAARRFSWWPRSPADSAESRATAAAAILFLLGVTFFLGAAHHWNDPRWRDGTVLGKLLTDPFLSPAAGWVAPALVRWPAAAVLLKAAAWIALACEFLLWPLSRFSWGKAPSFAILVGFSLFAELGVQAGPVGCLALALTVVLFAPPQPGTPSRVAPLFSRIARPAALVFFALSIAVEFLKMRPLSPLIPPLLPLARAFGLASPRVYNGWEIDGGELYFTIRERDGLRPPTFVLPSGARGPDLGSPALYFAHYGRWYRLAPDQKWSGGPTPRFREAYRRAIAARRLLDPTDHANHFEVEVFHRPTSLAGKLPIWGEPERVARFEWNELGEATFR